MENSTPEWKGTVESGASLGGITLVTCALEELQLLTEHKYGSHQVLGAGW